MEVLVTGFLAVIGLALFGCQTMARRCRAKAAMTNPRGART